MVDMKASLIKDTFREIRKSTGRFLSIFFIVMIGVTCFAGVKVTSPNMKITADSYFDANNFMDIQVISNLGLTDEDIEEIERIPEVEGIKGAYSKDVLTKIDDVEKVIRVHSLDIKDLEKDSKNYINKLKVIEGRLPQSENECVVEGVDSFKHLSIGDTIEIHGDNDEDIGDFLKNNKYTVVGKVQTPYYISHQKGSSSIGDGHLNSFISIPDTNFKGEVYTEAFVTLKGVKDKNSYDDDYKDSVETVKDKMESLGETRASLRYDEVIEKAKVELDDGKNKLKEKKTEVYKELSDAKAKLDKGKAEIEKGEKELVKKEKEVDNQIKDGTLKLGIEEKKLSDNEALLNKNYNDFLKNKDSIESQINSSKEDIQKGYENLNNLNKNLSLMEEKLKSNNLSLEERQELEKNIAETKTSIGLLKSNLDEGNKVLNTKVAEYNKAEETFKQSFKQISAGKEEIKKQKANIEQNKTKASKEFEKAREEIKLNKDKIANGEKEYFEGLEEAEKEFKKAEADILEGEKKINDIESGKWYVLDRNSNYGFVDFGNSAKSIDAIAQIFPVFFFLVATLICLTTITRMVDEQRVNIGTLKGLGYNKMSIAFKYVAYSSLASIGGGLLGLAVGLTLLPTVIFNSYATMTYILPDVILGINVPVSVSALVFAILITTLSSLFACYKELVETPATLMRPKAPKAGKRILIERIPFIWNKANFIQKVTLRNLFRYKKRFLMTVIGISGCTALLLSGFGIKDSISAILDKQYGVVFKYNAVGNYKSEVLKGENTKEIEVLSKDSRIEDYENVRIKNIDVFKGDKKSQSNIFVLEKPDKINDFVNTKNRTSKETYKLSNEGVIITEKLSKLLDVKIGDKISLEDENKKRYDVLIEGISENYVSHYVYMSPEFYKNIFGIEVKYNQILIKTKNIDNKEQNIVSNEIINNTNITSVDFSSRLMESFDKMLSNLNYVILLMIVLSGSLAFVVLYNLTNVNISERLREIATIKVLGFYDKEVSQYVFRENVILTAIGAGVGLLLGVFLHRFIIVTAELDSVMFGREVGLTSFLTSAALTIVFSLLVNIFMYHKLKKIKMVESLKSVD